MRFSTVFGFNLRDVEIELRVTILDDGELIVGVEDDEISRHADGFAVLAQNARAEGWKVPTHIRRAPLPTRRLMRSFISFAALLVKVTASTCSGETPCSLQQEGDAVREHARLAAAGAGENKQRPIAIGDRFIVGAG